MLFSNSPGGGLKQIESIIKMLSDPAKVSKHLKDVESAEASFISNARELRAGIQVLQKEAEARDSKLNDRERELGFRAAEIAKTEAELRNRQNQLGRKEALLVQEKAEAEAEVRARLDELAAQRAAHQAFADKERAELEALRTDLTNQLINASSAEQEALNREAQAEVQQKLYEGKLAKLKEVVG